MDSDDDALVSGEGEETEDEQHFLNLEDAELVDLFGNLQQDVELGSESSGEGDEGDVDTDDGDSETDDDEDATDSSSGDSAGQADGDVAQGEGAQHVQQPDLPEEDTSEDVDSSDTDSDDEYRRATTKKVSSVAAAIERELAGGVSVDLHTAVQRGCLLYVLPDGCGAYGCSTKAQHFQTMDCLAIIPQPPPPPPPRQQPTRHAAAAVGHAAGASAQAPQHAGSTVAGAAAAGAVPGAGAGAAAQSAVAAAAQAAAGAAHRRQELVQGPAAAGRPVAEDEDLELLLGGPARLTVCRVPAPGRAGPLVEVCSAQLQTNHYSVAVSPDGRFVAAGGDRGFLYIYAYLRGAAAADSGGGGGSSGCGGCAGASGGGGSAGACGGMERAAAWAARGADAAEPPDSAARPAELVRLAAFAFPVRGGFWGMNNMVRFGLFGGALRLMVAAQDKAIYIFNVPAWDGSAASLPSLADHRVFACAGLPHWSVHWEQQPAAPAAAAAAAAPLAAAAAPPQQPAVGAAPEAAASAGGGASGGGDGGGGGGGSAGRRYPNAGAASYWSSRPAPTLQPQPDITPGARTPSFIVADGGEGGGAQLVLQDVPATTAIVGWTSALNCVEPAADGSWLAVGCDEPLIYLVPAGPDYPSRPIEALLVPLPPSLPGRLAPGCQYCRFNGDATRLAASFDALFTVFVFDVPRRQLLFDMRHTQWQPPLALSWLPTPPCEGGGGSGSGSRPGPGPGSESGSGSGLLVHAVDRQHLMLLDVDSPRTTLSRISIKPPGLRSPPAGPHPTAGQQPQAHAHQPEGGGGGGGSAGRAQGTAPSGPEPPGQAPGQAPAPQEHAAAGGPAPAAAAEAGADAAGGSTAPGPGPGPGPLSSHLLAGLRTGRERAEARALRRERRRRERPPRITGMATTADGRLLVTTKTELLTFRLLLPDAPWSHARHRHMPPAFKAAARTLLLCAAAGHTSPPAPAGVAAASAAEAAAPSPPPPPVPSPGRDTEGEQCAGSATTVPGGAGSPPGGGGGGAGGGGGGLWSDAAGEQRQASVSSSSVAAAAGAQAQPEVNGRRPAQGCRPTGLPCLPHDTLESIIAAASRPHRAWALTPAEDVLAFPVLDGWAQGWDGSGRSALGGGEGSGRGGTGDGAGVSEQGQRGIDLDPWVDWDVAAR